MSILKTALIFSLLFVFVASVCPLTQTSPAKAYPSLIRCYKHNMASCCVSIHDNLINKEITTFLSPSCSRMFPEMENYFCFGCNSASEGTVNATGQTIRMCKEYLERVWGASLDSPTFLYDNCGFYTYWRDTPTAIVPSKEWKTGYDFFKEAKPTHFSNYTIEVVEDNANCYNNARRNSVAFLGLVILLLLSL